MSSKPSHTAERGRREGTPAGSIWSFRTASVSQAMSSAVNTRSDPGIDHQARRLTRRGIYIGSRDNGTQGIRHSDAIPEQLHSPAEAGSPRKGLAILFCAIVLFVLGGWYLGHRQRSGPRAIR
jgi:hypothetical protein